MFKDLKGLKDIRDRAERQMAEVAIERQEQMALCRQAVDDLREMKALIIEMRDFLKGDKDA